MGSFLQLLSWLLVMMVTISAQKRFKQVTGLQTVCLGNRIKIAIDKSLVSGDNLAADVIRDREFIPITTSRATQCGYSRELNPLGKTNIYASVLGCDIQNQDDEAYEIDVRLRLYGDHKSDPDVQNVNVACNYNRWADREVVCEKDYMEVSVNRLVPTSDQTVGQPSVDQQNTDVTPKDVTDEKNIWKVVFHTPKEKSMLLADAQKAGYTVSTTPKRLVMRLPYNASELNSDNVSGVPMWVLKATTYFKTDWSVTMLDTTAACPTEESVEFTENTIIWYIPLSISSLSSMHDVMEVYMGISGERLSEAEMAKGGYSLSVTNLYYIITIPVGSPDGYYKSYAPEYQYHIAYTIYPLIDVLWQYQDQSDRQTIMRALTTPLSPRPPHVTDNTVPEERVFDVVLGTFLYDVVLVNVTFATGVLTLAEANARGFNVKEHSFANHSKTFSLQVPFADPVVLKSNPNLESTTYTLPMIFGLTIFPEDHPFAHPVVLEATLEDVVLPVISGACDDEYFYAVMDHGSKSDLKTIVGERELTPELARQYDVHENATHCTMRVPFNSPDVVNTFAISYAVGGRLDLKVIDPVNHWVLADYALACTFPMTLAECHPNGTVMALAPKIDSAPQVILSQLTLLDRSCRPTTSTDRFATFYFPLNSCGTTRTIADGYMIYENEIAMPSKSGMNTKASGKEYRVRISCYYSNEEFKTLPFLPVEQVYDSTPAPGYGQMSVELRLATDGSFTTFYTESDYPVVEYLRHPLYFEVQLMDSKDPELDLLLENCWATLGVDGRSIPRWDIIIDSCPNSEDRHSTVMHPVKADQRVQFPSHFKRFEMKMFAFVQDDTLLQDQIHIHCEAAICDRNRQSDAFCYRSCPSHLGNTSSDWKRRQSGKGNSKVSPRSKIPLTSGPLKFK